MTPTPTLPPVPRPAIALSGGGAKGDFQVGALRYLYDRGIRPSIVCGVSVGAVNTARLTSVAAPAGATEKEAALRGLEGLWRGLRSDRDMWQPEQWLTALDPAGRHAAQLAAALLMPIDPLRPLHLAGAVGSLGVDVPKLLSVPSARSVYNLGPIAAKLADPALFDPALAAASGMTVRFGTVSLATGRLRYITEGGALLERDGTPVMGELEEMPAACRPLAADVATTEAELQQAREDLKKAAEEGLNTSSIMATIRELSARLRRQRTAVAECLRTNAPNRVPVVVDLRQAVLASSAIPAFFPPVRLARDHYVDGGVREVLPLEVALDAGATVVYAISCSRVGNKPDDRYLSPAFDRPRPVTEPVLAGIVERTVDIFVDEIILTDAEPRRDWPAVPIFVIEPSVNPELHDILTIEPGLIDIAMAYGYMRAWDALEGDSRPDAQELRELTDAIVATRKQAWELEFAINGQRPPGVLRHRDDEAVPAPDGGFLADLRPTLRRLAALVRDRQARGGGMPLEARWWGESWHRHAWSPMTPSPWDAWPFTVRTAGYEPAPMGDEPPAVAAFPDGRIDVVGVGLDHGMFHKSWDGTAWRPSGHDWTPLGGVFTSAPTVCAWGGGRLEIFGRGLDGQLFHRSWTAAGLLQPQWEPLGGRLTGQASVVAWDQGRLDIFALDAHRGCIHKAWNGTDWLPSQLEWESLGGTFLTTPAAVSWAPGRLDVFGVGLDASLFHRAWTGSSWTSGWETLGGRLSHRPAVAAWAPDRLDVFVVQINGGMYHKSWEGNGWHPSTHDWESLGGIFTTAPAVVAWEPGRLDVFGCGLDRTCFHKAWDVTGWHPSPVAWDHLTDDFRDGNPLDRTVVFTSDPIAITTAPGRFDVFGFNVDRSAIRKSWDGEWWPSSIGWEKLGGTFAE